MTEVGAPANPPPAKAGGEPKGPATPVNATQFTKPATTNVPNSYMHVDSSPGDYIGQGKSYEYGGAELKAEANARGVIIRVDGWTLNLAPPKGQTLQVGEYLNAKRFPFNADAPGLNFSGKGRGSNRLAGQFVVWELEVVNNQVTRLAVDFLQRSEEKGPPLTGRVRINSTYK